MSRADCPITRPDPAFKAPSPWPKEAPASYGAAWFGTADLWTMIDLDGEVWMSLPPDGSGFGQKSWWWSANFPNDEFEPALVVLAEKVGGHESSISKGLGTNGSADFGRAMLQGIFIPSEGCWRLTGTYRGTSLSYVVWVGPLEGG